MSVAKPPGKRLTRRTIILLAILVLLLGGLAWDGSPLAGVLLRQAIHLKFSDVRQVTPSELVAWTRDPNRPPPLLVDARPMDQFRVSHIQGAVQLDPTHPDLAVFAHVPRDQPLVIYDATGVIGSAMVVALTAAGFSRASSLDGGIFRWVNEGHPVVADSAEVTRVHPVSWAWGRLLKARYRP